jgi:hypothetical protein
MYYINTKTGKYPLRTKHIRAENPDTSFGEIFTPPDWYKTVQPAQKPEFNEWSQDVEEVAPVQVNGVWTQQWKVIDRFKEYTDEGGILHTVQEQIDAYIENRTQAAATEIRYKRDILLKDSDWSQVADSPVDKLLWATYRQDLREITEQNGFPLEVIWPDKPRG